MIRPTRRFLMVMLAGLPIAMLTIFYEPMWMIWLGYLGVWLILGGLDVLFSPARKELSAVLDVPSFVHLGEPARVGVEVKRDPAASKVYGDVDVMLQLEGPVEDVPVQKLGVDREDAAQDVELMPVQRGQVWVEKVHMRWSGPLGLFAKVSEQPVEQEIGVAPNIMAVRRAAIRMASHNAMMQGAKLLKFIGDGSEFESLREYTQGLNIRDIHWSASARHRKLLCRENRSERNHRVIIALDTGALMREPLEGMPKLDHAINSGLLLGFLSLKMGDQVGLLAFDSEVRSYIAPQPGVHSMQRLLKASTELKYTPYETNFTLAMSTLKTKLRRRAIIVVFTDFMDSVSAELMVENLGRLSRKHVVLFVALRDHMLDRATRQLPDSLDHISQAVVAGDMQRERDVVLTRLRRQGIFCIDGAPDEISVSLINRYLDVHRRELVA